MDSKRRDSFSGLVFLTVWALVAAPVLADPTKPIVPKNPHCDHYFFFGEGSDVRNSSDALDVEFYVRQGCYVNSGGNVHGAIPQTQSNGLSAKELYPKTNGAMNPRFSFKGKSIDQGNLQARPSETKDSFEMRAAVEFRGAEEAALEIANSKLLEEMKAADKTNYQASPTTWTREAVTNLAFEATMVGYMRLSAYNWFALLKSAMAKADDCGTVTVRFECPSGKFDGKVRPKYHDQGWEDRLRVAERTKLVSEIEQGPIRFVRKKCGMDASNPPRVIENIPMTCGSTYSVTKKVAKELEAGPCGKQIQYFNDENPVNLICKRATDTKPAPAKPKAQSQ